MNAFRGTHAAAQAALPPWRSTPVIRAPRPLRPRGAVPAPRRRRALSPGAAADPLTAVHFDFDGKRLGVGGYRTAPVLHAWSEKGGLQRAGGPAGLRDPAGCLTRNPAHRDGCALAAFARSVFISAHGGAACRAVAEGGLTLARR